MGARPADLSKFRRNKGGKPVVLGGGGGSPGAAKHRAGKIFGRAAGSPATRRGGSAFALARKKKQHRFSLGGANPGGEQIPRRGPGPAAGGGGKTAVPWWGAALPNSGEKGSMPGRGTRNDWWVGVPERGTPKTPILGVSGGPPERKLARKKGTDGK